MTGPCNCGSAEAATGKWVGVHSPDCASLGKRSVESLERAITAGNWAVLFLDGRNEHGSHVLPMLPTALPPEFEKQLAQGDYSEDILQTAEALGFKIGQHVVWTTWAFNEAQYGEYGYLEFGSYWEFEGINAEMSWLFNEGEPVL